MRFYVNWNSLRGRIFFVLMEKNVRTKGLFATGGSLVSTYMTFLSTHFIPLVYYLFIFLLPVAIPYRGLSLRNVAFASCCRKIQILSRVCKNIPRSRRSAFYGFLFLSFSLSFSRALALSFYLSAFPRYWDAHSTGFRQAKIPLFALTVPLGSSLFSNPGTENPWRAFPPRRDQCVMQLVTKKKIGWKRGSVSAPEDGGTSMLERAV